MICLQVHWFFSSAWSSLLLNIFSELFTLLTVFLSSKISVYLSLSFLSLLICPFCSCIIFLIHLVVCVFLYLTGHFYDSYFIIIVRQLIDLFFSRTDFCGFFFFDCVIFSCFCACLVIFVVAETWHLKKIISPSLYRLALFRGTLSLSSISRDLEPIKHLWSIFFGLVYILLVSTNFLISLFLLFLFCFTWHLPVELYL